MANRKEKETTEVSTSVFGGNVAMSGSAALASAMKESAEKDPRGAIGDSDYLNFSGKSGRYSIGSDGRAIQPDELWVVNISSFEDGWICWKSGKPAATRMANIMDAAVPVPDMTELGPFEGDGDGWYQAKGVTMKSLDHDQQGYFKINSISGVSVMSDLQKLIMGRVENGQASWPVLSLDSTEFTAGGFKNFKPVMDPEGWLNDSQIATALNDPDADIDELMENSDSSPVKAVAEPEADEPEEDAPTPRRRKRKTL